MVYFINVVRGFSLVLHDPEGSHYKEPKAFIMYQFWYNG